MGKVTFVAQIKQFNRKALASGDTQIRLTIDCTDTPKKQNEVMAALSDLQLGDENVKVTIEEENA